MTNINIKDYVRLYFDETGAYLEITPDPVINTENIVIIINDEFLNFDFQIEHGIKHSKVKIPDNFNYFIDELLISYEKEKIKISPPFSFEIKNADQINYMSEQFFSHRTRVRDKNAAFYQMLSAKRIMAKENPFYLSLVSIIGFRVSESPEHRRNVGLELIRDRLLSDINESNFSDPTRTRWWLSSGTTTSVLAIYYKDLTSAKEILESIFERRSDIYLSQILYWNLSAAMLIYGFLLFRDEEFEKSKKVFAYLFQITKQGLSEIFDDRNDRILSQYPDCNALIEIGRHAHACHAVLSGKKFKPGQRAVYPLDLKDYYIDFVAAVRRFPGEFNPKLTALMQAKDQMNKLKSELYIN